MAAKKNAARSGKRAQKGRAGIAEKNTKRVAAKKAARAPRTPSPVMAAVQKPVTQNERYLNVIEPRRIPQAAWNHFLEELAVRGHVADSCKAAGIKQITMYKHAEVDKEFAAAKERAHAQGMLCLEDEAKRRAVDGYDEPVFYKGEQVAVVRKYSDPLLTLLLQGRDARYRRKQEITGAEGGALVMMLSTMNDEELAAHVAVKQRELDEARKTE